MPLSVSLKSLKTKQNGQNKNQKDQKNQKEETLCMKWELYCIWQKLWMKLPGSSTLPGSDLLH